MIEKRKQRLIGEFQLFAQLVSLELQNNPKGDMMQSDLLKEKVMIEFFSLPLPRDFDFVGHFVWRNLFENCNTELLEQIIGARET